MRPADGRKPFPLARTPSHPSPARAAVQSEDGRVLGCPGLGFGAGPSAPGGRSPPLVRRGLTMSFPPIVRYLGLGNPLLPELLG